MKAIRDFLKEILTPQMIWVDETRQGHWVQKKRMHPMLRAFIGSGVVILIAIFGIGYFQGMFSFNDPMSASQEALRTAEKDPKILKPAPVTDAVEPADSGKPGSLTVVPDDVRAALKEKGERSVASVPEVKTVGEGGKGATLEIERKPKKDTPAPGPGKKTDKGQLTPAVIRPEPGKKVPALLRSRDYWIRIDKGDYKLSLYRGKELVKTYSVAVGRNPGDKRAIGDHRTPVGNFRVVSIENASKWKHDFGDGKGKIAGAYGPWFIRLDAKGWKGIGIHGTHDPDSRGTMATEGCIRLSNEEIRDLKRYAYRNMPVVIEE
ncbi:MAG: L,D-transpeptidase [Fretibacterium sp.]|nr:L,D-transpeptidase [Fretibacterium sp.]